MPPVPARDFFAAIWGEQAGVAELTVIDPGGIKSFPFEYPASLDSFVIACAKHSGKTNVYFGVTIRKPGTKIGHGKRGKAVDAQAATCAWADIDFKTTPKEKVREAIKTFPVPPSIVVMTGGGVHVYWFFRESIPASDLKIVYDINNAVAVHFGGDRQCKDMARVLRVPTTLNVKYSPPVPCEVTLWHPERKYNPSDFDFLPREAEPPPRVPDAPDDGRSVALPTDVRDKIAGLLKDIWIDGWKHKMALYLAGVFAHAGINEASAKQVVQMVSDANDGDTPKRLKDVEDTYKGFADGKKIAGAPCLEKMIREEFPAVIQKQAEAIFNEALKLVKKASSSSKSNFEIEKLIKFDSRPARWRVVIRMADGEVCNVDSETKEFQRFSSFEVAALEQTNRIIECKQAKWKKMLTAALVHIEIVEAPEEANQFGALGVVLDEFLDDKHESPDVGLLKAVAGYDENEVYFRIRALEGAIRERGIRFDNNALCQLLNQRGFKSATKRVNGVVTRLWKMNLSENGNGHVTPVTPVTAKPTEIQPNLPGLPPEQGSTYDF
jgi:hypothetical protein